MSNRQLQSHAGTDAPIGMPLAVSSQERLHSAKSLTTLNRKCPAARASLSNATTVGQPAAVRSGFIRILAQFEGEHAGAQAAVANAAGIDQEAQQGRADETSTYTCAQARADGCSACPAGGCILPDGEIAQTPLDLLDWDECDIKKVGEFVLAQSVASSSFDVPLIRSGGRVLCYANGIYGEPQERMLIERVQPHLGPTGRLSKAKTIATIIREQYAVDGGQFVPSRDYICFSNGTLNVTTGRLEAPSPAHRLLNRIEHKYVPEPNCPEFLGYLSSVWRDDVDKVHKIRFIRQWMGYLMTSDASMHKMLVLLGDGRNGKSVLTHVISQMLGSANVTNAMPDRLNVHAVRMQLADKLLNVSSDLPCGKSMSGGPIKAIVGGEAIEAALNHGQSETINQYCRLMIATNHMPMTKDTSTGYFDRLVILGFNRYFSESERDTALQQKLVAEMPGIIAWALEGLYDLRAQGSFTVPASSTTALRSYMAEASPVQQFADECLTGSVDGSRISSTKLFELYVNWCKQRRFNPGTITAFSNSLKTLSYQKVKASEMFWSVSFKDNGATSTAMPAAEEVKGAVKAKIKAKPKVRGAASTVLLPMPSPEMPLPLAA